MSDADLRELRHRCETEGDTSAWSRLAHAYSREARWDEAGWALVQARARGGENPEVEDALESAPVDDFSVRALPSGQNHAPISSLAWTPDGQRLVCGTDGRAVHVVHVRTGESRRLARVEGRVSAIATDLDGTTALVWSISDDEDGPVSIPYDTASGSRVSRRVPLSRLTSVDLASGETRRARDVRAETATQLTAWRTGRKLSFVSGGAVLALDDEGEPREVRRAPRPESGLALGWDGTAIVLGRGGSTVVLHEPPSGGLKLFPYPLEAYDHLRPGWRPPNLRLPTARAAHSFAENVAVLDQIVGPNGDLYFSPGGRFVAHLGPGGTEVAVLDLATRKRRIFPPSVIPRALAWAPSGRMLAVSTDMRTGFRASVLLLTLGEDVTTQLDAEYAVLAEKPDSRLALVERLERDPSAGATEWLVRVLERGAASDETAQEVVAAARCLARRRQLVDLERVKAARALLPERAGVAGLADYRSLLDWLALVLERARAGDRCTCNLSFPSALDHGSLEVTGREPSTKSVVTLSRCTVCGRRWRIAREVNQRTGVETSLVAELPT